MRRASSLLVVGLGIAVSACGAKVLRDEADETGEPDEIALDAGADAEDNQCPASPLACDSDCRSGQNVWARLFGAGRQDYARAISIDSAGNVVLVGSFQEEVTFCERQLTSQGRRDGYVVKYSPEGRHLWNRQLGTPEGSTVAEAVRVAPGGDVIVAGAVPNPPAAPPSRSVPRAALIHKYTRDGESVWRRTLTSSMSAVAVQVDVDAAGAIAVAGSFTGTLDTAVSSYDSADRTSPFVVRLSAEGVPTWSRFVETTGDAIGRSIAVGGDGDAFVLLDALSGPVDYLFQDGSVYTADVLVARFSSSGRFRRAYVIDHTSPVSCACSLHGLELALDSAGRPLIAGTYGESAGSHAHTTIHQEGFIQRIEADGSATPLASWLGSALGIAVGSGDRVYVTGDFSNAIDLGSYHFSAVGFTDGFAARLTPGGAFEWATGFGSHALDSAVAIAPDADGNVFVAGHIGDHHAPSIEVDFGNGSLSTMDQTDGFLARFSR